MKKEKLFRYTIGALSLLMLLVWGVGFLTDVGIIETIGFWPLDFLVSGTSGMALANIPVAGTPTYENTETSAPGHLQRDISTIVTEIKPDEFPLDTMVRNIRKAEQASNVKVEYETVTYREREDALTSGFTAAGSAADNSVLLDVGDKKIWGTDDTIYVPDITTGTVNGKALRLHVTEVLNGSNQIRVSALNATTETRVPTIANSTSLYRMATAKEELASLTDVVTQLPSQDFNYAQIHMCYLEQSVLNDLHKSYSGYSHQDKVLQEVYNMRSSCEATHLFGVRKKFIDPVDNEVKYHSNGIETLIGTTETFGTGGGSVDPTLSDVLTLLERSFSGNAGSTDRILLAGKKVITGLENITFSKEQMATEIAMFHGVNVSRLESNFGVLNIKHSKMLDAMGWQNKAMILDLEHIYKHDLESMKSEKLDPDKAGLRRVKDAVRILENCCITLRYNEGNDPVHLIWEPAA